jgi:hypothetical protein
MLEQITPHEEALWRAYYEVLAEEAEQARQEAEAQSRRRR